METTPRVHRFKGISHHKEVAASEQGSSDGGGKRGSRAAGDDDRGGQHEDGDSDDESLSGSEDLVDYEDLGTALAAAEALRPLLTTAAAALRPLLAKVKVRLDCAAQQLHVFSGMQQLLRESKFCDVSPIFIPTLSEIYFLCSHIRYPEMLVMSQVTVTVADTSFQAHAVVLAAASEFFRHCLNKAVPSPSPTSVAGAAGEKSERPSMHINLEVDQRQYCATPAGFAAVLECIYSGKLVADEDLIPSIFYLSTKLMLPAIRSACVAHLVSRVSEGTMVQMEALGEELGCVELIEASKAATRRKSSRASSKIDLHRRSSGRTCSSDSIRTD